MSNGRQNKKPGTIHNVSYRQKGARRYPLDLTDEKTVVGITTMQGESRQWTSQFGNRPTRSRPASKRRRNATDKVSYHLTFEPHIFTCQRARLSPFSA